VPLEPGMSVPQDFFEAAEMPTLSDGSVQDAGFVP
jgi:hypothetical protein